MPFGSSVSVPDLGKQNNPNEFIEFGKQVPIKILQIKSNAWKDTRYLMHYLNCFFALFLIHVFFKNPKNVKPI